MQFFQPRKQRRGGPVAASASVASLHRPYSTAGDGFTTPVSVTPPPEYQAYDSHFLQPVPPHTGYAQLYGSQPSLAAPTLYGYGGGSAASASTSTISVTRPHTAGAWEQGPAWQSTTIVATRPVSSGGHNGMMVRRMNQGAAFCDRVAARVNDMLSRDDGEPVDIVELETLARGLDLEEEREAAELSHITGPLHQQSRSGPGSGGIINFRKTWMYHNSRLPPGMVPFVVYLPTWSLVCRAAQASLDVYNRPRREQREGYTDADPKQGTKATVIKSQTVDDRKLLIVAIRGSQKNIVDWHVNFGFAPTQPVGFIDDEGNACHAGFLQVARAMISSVAAQLRTQIEQDPAWVGCSLLFTGHSAGGAVASLLYMHMLSKTVESDLTILAGVFRRVHGITFGTPPLSLLPLQLPRHGHRSKDQFLSFANEGDLVVRADCAYIKSLARLVAAPAPSTSSRQRLRERVSRQKLRGDVPTASSAFTTRWQVPDASLSTAGRMVLLREKPHTRNHAIEAVQLTDEELRGVVFGDPAMHRMSLYRQRVDELAFAAVSGRDAG